MEVVLWTRETVRHAPVVDAARERDLRWSDLEKWTCRAVQGPRLYPSAVPCAACDWDEREVREARRAKAARLKAWQRTGKLPTAWMKVAPFLKPKQKPMSDAEANRVVLPLMAATGKMRKDNSTPTGQVAEYLRRRGERWKDGGGWSCGCAVRQDTGERAPHVKACGKHRWALEGREEA